MRIFGIASIVLLLTQSLVFAQHAPVVSQYMINGIAINPAFAGTDDVLSFMVSARKQWTGLKGAPTTEVLSAHGPFRNERFALGVQLFQDKVGVSKSSGISTLCSYYVPTESGRIYFGLSTGVSYLRTQLTQLNPLDSGDPLIAIDPPTGILPQFGTGMLYRTKRFFVSASVPYILSHSLSSNGAKYVARHKFSTYNFFVGGGVEINLNESFLVRPSVLLKTHATSGSQIDLNVLVVIKSKIEVGCSIRLKDAILGIVKIPIKEQLYATYSYDYNISELQTFNSGSHEISLNYSLWHRAKIYGPRTLLW